MKQFLQYLRLDRYRLAAASIVALAIILRIVLIAQSWPVLDSDEGTMGIMGLDIAYRGATPVFFYGQNYMGALEAYLAAPIFYLFGPTGFALHCGLLFIYASSLGVIYLLTSALYSRGFALFTMALPAFGSSEMFARHLTATGGYPESFLFSSSLY